MKLWHCRGCEAHEKEIERLHRQIQRLTDLVAEKTQPGISQRIPHALPLPPTTKVGADGKRYVPRVKVTDGFPGYEPDIEEEMVEFVETEE